MVPGLSNLVQVPSTDPDDARRRRLLNILVLGIGALCLIGWVVALVARLAGNTTVNEALIGGITMLLGLAGVFLINRYGSAVLASSLFLILFTLVLIFSDRPSEVVDGRVLALFTMPILMASVLLRSYASFIAAVLITIALAVFANWQGLPVNPFISIGFFGLALISWLASRSLERALEEVRTVNAELAQRVAERQRLAGEIHDTLAQGFTSIVMQLESAEPHIPPTLTTIQHHLDQARYIARDSLAESRRLMWTLQPSQLEQASLPDAIQRVVNRWSKESKVATTTTITGQHQRLSPDIEVTLLRATQEALANIRKHAAAQTVTITLSYMNDLVMLDVQDDGQGFESVEQTAALPSPDGGYGLKAMRQRVSQLGGSLQVESEPGEGTTVVVQLPV